MLIEVTQDDIDKGLRGSAYQCMLARALARSFGVRCYVGGGSYCLDGHTLGDDLPPIADDAYRAFDNGRPVAPFTFELPEPAHATR